MPSANDVYITPASRKIEWYGSSAMKGQIHHDDTNFYVSGTLDLKLQGGDDISLMGYSGGSIITFGTDQTERMRLTEAGNFGIGTPAPAQKLYVSGGAASLDNAGGVSLYLKNAGSTYLSFDSYGGPGVSIAAPADMHVSGASGITFKTAANGIVLAPTGTSAGDTLPLRFRELAANGTATIRVRAPDSISSENTWVLPPDIGTANQVLTVASVASTEMTLDWADASGGGGGTIGGTVASGYIPVASSTDTLANGVLFTSGATESMYIGATPGTLNAANYNTTLGYQAGDDITSGDENTLMGQGAGANVTTGGANTAMGRNAGFALTTQGNNTMVGSQAGQNTTASYNTLVGALAGYNNGGALGNFNNFFGFGAGQNIQGAAQKNVAIGTYALYGNASNTSATASNVAIGHETMKEIEGGYQNIGIGTEALLNTTSGYRNIGIGFQALKSATTAAHVIAIGYLAGDAQTTDTEGSIYIGQSAGGADYGTNRSIFIGFDAGNKNTTGGNNLAIGHKALEDNTTGIHNVVIGREAGKENTGNQNVALGTYALKSSVAHYYNTAIGDSAMQNSTSGDRNVAVGTSAMMNDSVGTGGSNNVAVGFGTLRRHSDAGAVAIGSNSMTANTSGEGNTAVGYNTLLANTTGSYQTAIGYDALYSNTTGNYNTAVGYRALYNNVDGDRNTAIGYQALHSLEPSDGGGQNTAVGDRAGYKMSTGHTNVTVGYIAGYEITTGERNVVIGHEAAQNANTMNHSTVIGTAAGRNLSGSSENVVIGRNSGYFVTGGYNVFVGNQAGMGGASIAHTATESVAIGRNAFYYNAGANYSVAIGSDALMGPVGGISGVGNVAIGRQTMKNATTANLNVAIGYSTMYDATEAAESVAIGGYAAGDITTGKWNTVVGYTALRSGTTANRNTALGYASMKEYTQAGDGYNTAVGMYAMMNVQTGSSNVAIGYTALRGATGHDMDYNVAVGVQALYSNTSGDNNVAVGRNALFANTTAGDNTVMGTEAGDSITTGGENTIVGRQALATITDGINNVAMGRETMRDAAASSGYNTAIGSSAFGYGGGTLVGATGLGYGAGYYSAGNYNTYLGHRAGYGSSSVKSNYSNVAVGRSALTNITSGYENIAIGVMAGENVTTANRNVYIGRDAGHAQVASAEYGVMIGQEAGLDVSGQRNTIVGGGAGHNAKVDTSESTYIGFNAGANCSGAYATFVGSSAGISTNAGTGLTALGFSALRTVTGNSNTAIGWGAMADGAGNAGANVAVGYRTLQAITTGDRNNAVGNYGLSSVTTENDNTTMGDEAGKLVQSSNNTIIGSRAGEKLDYNTNGAGSNVIVGAWAGRGDNGDFSGGYNVIMGAYAMNDNALTTARDNVAIGYKAASGATSMVDNVIIGDRAGMSSTTASYSTFVGHEAGYDVTTGTENTYIGYHAGRVNATANYNVFMGNGAGEFATGVANSVVIGRQAMGAAAATGDDNTIVGYQAGYDITSGHSNVLLGSYAGTNITDLYENTIIGFRAGQSLASQTTHGRVTLVGYQAGYSMTGTDVESTVMVGWNAGYNYKGTKAATLVGGYAGYNLSGAGDASVAIGIQAGYGAATGFVADNSVFIGNGIAETATASQYDVFIGGRAGGSLGSTSLGNTVVGFDAGRQLGNTVNAQYNIILGYQAGYYLGKTDGGVTGVASTGNVAIGKRAGMQNRGGNKNVYIGFEAGPPSATSEANKLYINNAESSTPLIGGDFSSDYVDINGNLNTHNIRPLADNTYALGTPGLSWTELHLEDYIELNAASATTNHAGTNRFWVSGTTPFFNNQVIQVGGGDPLSVAAGRFSQGAASQAGILMSDYGAATNSASNAGTVTYLYWDNNTSTLHSRNLSMGGTFTMGGQGMDDILISSDSASTSNTALVTAGYVNANGGGGTIGGSITDNQVAIGASTANSIEGSANLTYDGTKLTIARTADNTSRGISILDNEGTETISLATASGDQGLLYLKGPTGGNAIYLDGGTSNSYIDAGNVGIGTTSPAYKLDVFGGARVKGLASHQTLELRGDTNYGAYINYVRNNGSFAFRTGMITNASRWDITDYQGAGYEAISVQSDLKVGINNTSPPSTLGIDGAVSIKERADHETVTAAYGQIWVKNAAPNTLYFTDDAGTDHQLGAGGTAGANLTLSNLDAGTAINSSLVSDADNTDDLGSSAVSWRKVYTKEYNGFDTNIAQWAAGVSANADIHYSIGPQALITSISAAGGIVTGIQTQQAPSDSKVKDNVKKYTTGLSLIDKLEPKTWNWNDSKYGDTTKTNYGLMADDVEAINSSFTKVHSTHETHGEIKGFSEEFTNQYNMALLQAVKDLSAKNDALEARIVELEGKL